MLLEVVALDGDEEDRAGVALNVQTTPPPLGDEDGRTRVRTPLLVVGAAIHAEQVGECRTNKAATSHGAGKGNDDFIVWIFITLGYSW